MRTAWHREVRVLALGHTESGFRLRECDSTAAQQPLEALGLSKTSIPAPSSPSILPAPPSCALFSEAVFPPHLHHAGQQEHQGCTLASVLRSQGGHLDGRMAIDSEPGPEEGTALHTVFSSQEFPHVAANLI